MGSAQHTYISEGVWDVSQTIVSIHGCVYSSVEPMLIATYPWPVAEFSADPWQQALPETRVEFANYSLGAETYEWDFGGFETSLAEHPVFTFPDTQSGEYTVSLVSENAWGCRDTVEHTVMIQESFALFIPNMFTPDNDGLNDAWQLAGIDVDRAEFQVWVLDRWGEIVFHSTNIEEPWIGDMMGGGHYVPNGTYLYRVEARSLATGENHVATGHVTLAR
jgi:gliding motility-associated-like protein